jgi:hypothetical protein
MSQHMDRETYAHVIDTLQSVYGKAGIPLYERGGLTYPLTLIPAGDETLDTLLASSPPREAITRDELPVYDDTRIAQIRANGGNLYDAPTFAFHRLERNPLRLHARIGSYFDHVSTCVALEHELIQGGPTLLRTQLHQTLDPARVTRVGTGRSAAIGVNALVVFRGADGYRALFTQRSSKTAHKPGAYHVIPAFTFQPSETDYASTEWNLFAHIRREYLEELFNVPEAETGQQVEETQAGTEFDALLDDGRAELIFTGMTANLMTTHVSVCSLLLIHDPDWWPTFQQETAAMWETNHTYTLPIDNDADLLAALPPDAYRNMAPNGASALWLGIDRARQHFEENVT